MPFTKTTLTAMVAALLCLALWAASALALWAASGYASAKGQNVSGYDRMPNPYLLLLREPAVHDDLQLTISQRRSLQQINDQVDGPLLALRNWSAPEAHTKFLELVAKTRAGVEQVFSAQQQQRLRQIIWRVKKARVVLDPAAASKLQLTGEQKKTIQTILNKTDVDPQKVLSELSQQQKKQLTELLGPKFDVSKLGRTRFKAPDFIDSDGWINGGKQQLSSLRRKVVAVHFFAFG